MNRKHHRFSLIVIPTCIVAVVMIGCEKSEPAKPKADEKSVSINVDVPSATVAILVSADAVDGKTDKIVARCAGCALGMDGKSEFALSEHGYTMYFCSAGCKDGFAKDVEKNILAIKVPAK